jgi:hypothetical protein
MSVKLLMTWDIKQGLEQEYFEFVVREFIPAIQRLGMETSDAWFTMYGECPQIMVGAVSSDQKSLEATLGTVEWEQMVDKLLEYVENFEYKIVPARRGFQL